MVPICNPNNKFTPDAGVVRYAGFVHRRDRDLIVVYHLEHHGLVNGVLNLESCCLPTHINGSLISNLSISTRFYLHLLAHPLCLTENVTIHAESGEIVILSVITSWK